LGHLWFVTIHPFEDGNVRIGRAIMEMALARAEKSSLCFFSVSHQIEKERKEYYDVLQQTQSGLMSSLEYVEWFLGCLLRAFDSSTDILSSVLYRGILIKNPASGRSTSYALVGKGKSVKDPEELFGEWMKL